MVDAPRGYVAREEYVGADRLDDARRMLSVRRRGALRNVLLINLPTDALNEPLRPLPSLKAGLPRLPETPFQRAVPITPADRDRCICRLLPRLTRPSPLFRRVGIRNFTSRPAQASLLRYGPLDCSAAQGGLCHEALARSVTRQSRPSATRSNRPLSGWHVPPLVFRAIGAH